jgi:hypothetical protein
MAGAKVCGAALKRCPTGNRARLLSEIHAGAERGMINVAQPTIVAPRGG